MAMTRSDRNKGIKMSIPHAFAMSSTLLVVGSGLGGYAASKSNAAEVGNRDAEKNVIDIETFRIQGGR